VEATRFQVVAQQGADGGYMRLYDNARLAVKILLWERIQAPVARPDVSVRW
jgi:hypothetical protein